MELEVDASLEGQGVYVCSPAIEEARTAIETLRADHDVVWVEGAAPRSVCVVPDDPFYAVGSPSQGQWSLARLGMPAAWDVETGSADVTVAILDTGLDKDRPDFAGRIVSPYSVIDHSADWPYWDDKTGHGTAVAGIAAARGNDSSGMAGVAWNVMIMPVKIAEYGDSYDYVLAEGIYWAVDHGADVINISFAGDAATTVEQDAIEYALSHNVVVVAAAGNKAWRGIYYPAALPGVVAVGATDESAVNARASFSATGSELDVVAPGADIWSFAAAGFGWAWWSGTSFSSPMVAGVAALIRSAAPELAGDQVVDLLNASARDLGSEGWDQEFGWGLVDPVECLQQATGSSPASTTTTLSSTSTTHQGAFADVGNDHTYAGYIDRLAERDIVEGDGTGYFHPDDDVKRQQFAKMIVLTLGYVVNEEQLNPFSDVTHVPGVLYPYHYVSAAYLSGITKGTASHLFSPYLSLSRAQMITMVMRAADLPDPPSDYVPPFANFSAIHYPFARRAAWAGLLDRLTDSPESFDFMAPASRGEVCALLEAILR